MSLVLGYDTETTGLDRKEDYVLEVAAVIYDTELKQPVDFYSSFVLWPSRPAIPARAFQTHHITDKMLEDWGSPAEEVFATVLRMAQKCDWVVGHNVIDFDKPITSTAISRCHDSEGILKRKFGDLKWMDTIIDLPFPETITTRTLKFLALEHGYIAQGSHRALSDVLACLHLLSCYDFSLVERIASTPIVQVKANVTYMERELAKVEGFKWNPETKQWLKTMRQFWLDDKARQLGFDTEIL